MIAVHFTICPGCGLGCGLYLMQSTERGEAKCGVMHRKVAPVNAGKLCKFGMHLPKFYARSRMRTTIDGKDAKVEDAASDLKERLTTMRPDEIAFIALPGMVTNEEMAAILSMCKSTNCRNIVTGFEPFHDMKMHALNEIENAQKILLFFFDPFVQYPLIARRILRAKERGAEIIDVAFAENSRGIADRTILADEILQSTPPSDMGDAAWAVANALDDDMKDAFVIADLNPMTDIRFLDAISRINANVFLLKPFLNANGAMLLSSALDFRGEKDLFDVVEDVRLGKIKALYFFEADHALPFFSDSDLADIELLAVQGAFESSLCRNAHITISNDPFFMRRGTVINAEGRVLDVGGSSCDSVEIINEISGEHRSYGHVHEVVRSLLGFSDVSEQVFVRGSDAKKRSRKSARRKGRSEEKSDASDGMLLWYKTNPFFWYGIRDKDFVEISPEAARELQLFRGERIIIRNEGREERTSFKIADIPSYLVISEVRLSVSSRILSPVEIMKAAY